MLGTLLIHVNKVLIQQNITCLVIFHGPQIKAILISFELFRILDLNIIVIVLMTVQHATVATPKYTVSIVKILGMLKTCLDCSLIKVPLPLNSRVLFSNTLCYSNYYIDFLD